MKKPHVLNRAMFNRGGTSAYGRGITSNLVTEEQRQKFNYGGRVGLRLGTPFPKVKDSYRIFEGNKIPMRYLDQTYPQDPFTPAVKNWWDMSQPDGGLPSVEQLQEEEYYGPLGNYKPYQIGTATGVRGSENPILARGTGEKGDVWFGEAGEEVQEFADGDVSKIGRISEIAEKKAAAKERALDVPIIDQNIREKEEDNIPGEIMADSDTMDWESIYEPTPEQKRRTKGEGQLGLAAAALDVFSQPTIAKGMKAASPHLLNLGKTATADQKARDKAILQGKVLSKVYTDRAGAKGKADIELAEWKKKNASESDLSDIENYIGTTTAWKNKTKEKKMSGETHQDLIGTFDEEVAQEAIVINPKTTGIGDKAVTTIPEGDQKQLDAAKEGDTIIIGEEIFVKDSSAPGGMRKVSYTQLKKLKQGKKKKAKTYLDLAQGL